MTTGLDLRPRCSYCGALAKAGQRWCVVCGRTLGDQRDAGTAETPALGGPPRVPAADEPALATPSMRAGERQVRTAGSWESRPTTGSGDAGDVSERGGERRVVLVLISLAAAILSAWLVAGPRAADVATRAFPVTPSATPLRAGTPTPVAQRAPTGAGVDLFAGRLGFAPPP